MKHILIPVLLMLTPSLSAQGAFLGVQLAPESQDSGASIAAVEEHTAAALASLQPGDRILAVNNTEVATAPDLVKQLSRFAPGDYLTLRVQRGDKTFDQAVILGRRPSVARDFPVDRLPDRQHPDTWGGAIFPDWMDQIQKELPDWGHFDRLMPPGFDSFPRFHFRFDFPGLPGLTERKVHVRYPGDTPEDQREALIAKAKEEYGDEVEVEFAGEGTSISIQSTFRSGGSTAEEQEEDF